ncbi:MAG: hypothetical protein HZB42_03410 [Sphingobacteriales bacterium]|nr:hypothetical protein [Sphingobacteriales bacterium]
MSFFDRLSNGWNIAMNSFKVLKENKQLIIFPVLSGLSLLVIIGSFFFLTWKSGIWDDEQNLIPSNSMGYYLIIFGIYLVNYFIVVFFNMALIHCTRLYFRGEEVTVRAGMQYSFSRIGAIFSWACFAATIGLLLKVIQENVGWLGKIITGLIGVMWSIATFFVVPVIAYENLGPLQAFKRSSLLMKEKWGESLAATFSFGLIQFLGILAAGIPLYLIGSLIHPVAAIGLAVLGVFIVISIISATETIFVSAVYHNITGDPVKHLDLQMVEKLFEKKENK